VKSRTAISQDHPEKSFPAPVINPGRILIITMIKTGVFKDFSISRELQVIRETIGYPIGNKEAGFSPGKIVYL
jgi:hypothetical protein